MNASPELETIALPRPTEVAVAVRRKPSPLLTRRRFLVASTIAAAAIAVPVLRRPRYGHAVLASAANPETLSRIFPVSTLSQLGEEYLNQTSGESGENALVTALLAPAGDRQRTQLVNEPPALARFLAEQVAAEYRSHQTVLVDGWILAPTEARQCALYALLHRG